jgi:hypothetical protein
MQHDPSLLPIARRVASEVPVGSRASGSDLIRMCYERAAISSTWNLQRACDLSSMMPSTVIKSFEYDAASKELLVVFRSGRRYIYLDVPEVHFVGLKSAFSKGDYFNTHIRENYKFIRLAEDA